MVVDAIDVESDVEVEFVTTSLVVVNAVVDAKLINDGAAPETFNIDAIVVEPLT